MTASPWRTAPVTPGSSRIASTAASGSVALMVRDPTRALISVAGPSATTRPVASRMARSALASASSR